MTDGTTIPTSTTTIRSKDGEDDGGDEVMGVEVGTATTTTTQLTGATATGRDMTTRGREMTQQRHFADMCRHFQPSKKVLS